MTKNKVEYFQMQKKAPTEAEIYIYGPIVTSKWEEDEVTASDFKDALNALGDVNTLNVHINSGGGNVFGGHAIYNMLKSHKAKVNVYVDALAASIASVIAMAGDTIYMHENSMMMIHNSWIVTMGNAVELRKTADLMDKMDKVSNTAYLSKSDKFSQEELETLLKEDYWMTAQEAVELGFADEIISANEIAASITKEQFEHYRNVPAEIAEDVGKVKDVSDIDGENNETDAQPDEEAQKKSAALIESMRLISEKANDYVMEKKYKEKWRS